MSSPLQLNPSDRGILVGVSGSGKSTLANHILTVFRQDHPDARILVLDTKPRWRAERKADGTSTRRLYAKMGPGDFIPGAVRIDMPNQWGMAWDRDNNPVQTVVVQGDINLPHRVNVAFQTAAAAKFFNELDYRRPSLIYYDEGHDFFSASGTAYESDIIQRGYRAGRERGLTSLIGFQRPIGFNPQCMTETNYCALFHLSYDRDMRRLYEMGWPKDIGPPDWEDFEAKRFKLWRQGKPGAPTYHLQLSDRKAA